MNYLTDLTDRLRSMSRLPDTPAYIYDPQGLGARIAALRAQFDDLFQPSFAIKSNPNLALLRLIADQVPHIDASSFHEVERALSTGVTPGRISWSGPGKRQSELAALAGRGITMVVEAEDEIDLLATICPDLPAPQRVVLRINPDHVPRGFGASMSGKPSQFGIDEPRAPQAIDRIEAAPGLHLAGFHAYTGSNCLSAEPIAENFANLCRIFGQAAGYLGRPVETLIFGAGFGLPYHPGQEPLDIEQVAKLTAPIIDTLAGDPLTANAARLLEIGRWITGPNGALLTGVLSVKDSRGTRIAVCDAGFNNHLAAAGMMGSVFPKNYPFALIRGGTGKPVEHQIAGPLCTSIDTLARKLELPPLSRGDVLAVMMSGAYGLTASPTRFISHAEPAEYLIEADGSLTDISESRLNMPGSLLPELSDPA